MLKNENVAQQMKDLLEKIQSNLFDRYASFKKCHDIQLYGRKLKFGNLHLIIFFAEIYCMEDNRKVIFMSKS